MYAYGDDGAGQYESAWVSHQVKRLDTFGYAGAVTKYSLDGDGRKVSRPYFKNAGADWIGGTVYTYDDFGRVTGIGAENAAQETIVDFTRAYDYNGNPLYTEYGHKATRSELYGTQAGQDPEGPADALNRLTRYRRGTLNGNKDDLTAVLFEQDWHDTAGTLTLDKLGNWDGMRLDPDGDDTAQSMTATARGHNLANEYVSKDGQSAYAHDRNGNMTDDTKHTYYYDFANHLVVAVLKDTGDTVGQYRYDALGRRVRKVVDDVSDTLDGTTLFYYDGMRVIEEGRLDGQGAYTATHQYVWGFYLDELLVFDYDAQGDFDLEDTSDQRGHPFQDFIYSTAAVMDPDGNVLDRCDYEPYGAVTFWTPDYADTRAETQVHLDFLFTGQRFDPETGLYHYKARTLQPHTGQFLQPDIESLTSASSRYIYVDSAPHLNDDPLGRQSMPATSTVSASVTVYHGTHYFYRSTALDEHGPVQPHEMTFAADWWFIWDISADADAFMTTDRFGHPIWTIRQPSTGQVTAHKCTISRGLTDAGPEELYKLPGVPATRENLTPASKRTWEQCVQCWYRGTSYVIAKEDAKAHMVTGKDLLGLVMDFVPGKTALQKAGKWVLKTTTSAFLEKLHDGTDGQHPLSVHAVLCADGKRSIAVFNAPRPYTEVRFPFGNSYSGFDVVDITGKATWVHSTVGAVGGTASGALKGGIWEEYDR